MLLASWVGACPFQGGDIETWSSDDDTMPVTHRLAVDSLDSCPAVVNTRFRQFVHTLKVIRSLLFAAGRGERLRPLTDRVPKPALPLAGLPLAAPSLLALLDAAPPVAVNLSHLPEVATAALDRAASGAEFVVEPAEPYGTAGTLKALQERIGERLVTCNCDVLIDLSVADLIATHEGAGAAATLAVAEVARGGDFVVDGERIVDWIDRRRDPDAGGVRFLGMAVYESRALKRLPDDRPAGLGETLLRTLAEEGDLAAHVHRGYALDVGTPALYLQAAADILAGAAPWPQVVDRDAYVGRDVEVPGDAIGPGAMLLDGCRVEPDAYVERSIVWPGERVPAGTVVRDTIWAFGGPIGSL